MVLDPNHPQPLNAVSVSEVDPDARPHAGPDDPPPYETLGASNGAVRLTRAEVEADPRWPDPPVNGWLAAPLVGRDGRSMGLIQLSDKCEGEFTRDDESILIQLAQIASAAVENARLYQELRENDRRKDEFLAMLAHELRNPLAAIGNAVDARPSRAGPASTSTGRWRSSAARSATSPG